MTTIPFLRYRDAPAAIRFLVDAFGFEEKLVVPGEDGTIAHAELKFGSGMVMLGSAREDDFRMRSPDELGGASQGIYVVVGDPDATHARAKAAGAEIQQEAHRPGLRLARVRRARPGRQHLELRHVRPGSRRRSRGGGAQVGVSRATPCAARPGGRGRRAPAR